MADVEQDEPRDESDRIHSIPEHVRADLALCERVLKRNLSAAGAKEALAAVKRHAPHVACGCIHDGKPKTSHGAAIRYAVERDPMASGRRSEPSQVRKTKAFGAGRGRFWIHYWSDWHGEAAIEWAGGTSQEGHMAEVPGWLARRIAGPKPKARK